MCVSKRGLTLAFVMGGLFLSGWSAGDDLRQIKLQPDYDHDRFSPEPDILRKFAAFTVSFDSKDDDDGDGISDVRRVPEWVGQHIKRTGDSCVDTERRPNTWFTDDDLFLSKIAPNDKSYLHSGYDRGHLAPKILAARLGANAEWNTHTMLNAVPQRPRFNQQPWRRLERTTGAWAQTYCQIWVIQGPVFDDGPYAYIGDEGEYKVAIPHGLFKIVVRERGDDCNEDLPSVSESDPEILTFLYPQLGPGYYERGVDSMVEHKRFLTSLSEVERLTGLAFFPAVPEKVKRRLLRERTSTLWEINPPEGINDFVDACRS